MGVHSNEPESVISRKTIPLMYNIALIRHLNSKWWALQWSSVSASSSVPPVWDLQPAVPVHCKPGWRKFMPDLLPQHVHPIPWLGRVLEFKVAGDVLELHPHLNPLFSGHLPEFSNQAVWLESFIDWEEEGEFRVVKLWLKWELYVVADDYGDAVANDGIKEAAWGWGVACRVQTELGWTHALRRLVMP